MINSSHFSNKTRRNHRTSEDDPVSVDALVGVLGDEKVIRALIR